METVLFETRVLWLTGSGSEELTCTPLSNLSVRDGRGNNGGSDDGGSDADASDVTAAPATLGFAEDTAVDAAMWNGCTAACASAWYASVAASSAATAAAAPKRAARLLGHFANWTPNNDPETGDNEMAGRLADEALTVA